MVVPRLALVTGSTSGIGHGIAKALSAKGHSLVLNGFGTEAEVGAVVKACQEAGSPQVEHHGADVSRPEEVGQLFNFISNKYGRSPEILVNNAGVQFVSPVEKFPIEEWNRLLGINLSACFYTTRLAVSSMKERGWGRIINVASVHGLVASPNKSAYVAAKHGVVGLTKVIALETAGSGVTSNAICPGWVLTPILTPQIEAIAQKQGISFEEAKKVLVGEKHPSGEFATTEEVGAMVTFLCSDAAKQVTGSSFNIDGGWSVQ